MKINVISNMNINPFLFIQVLFFISLLFVPSVKSAPFCSIGCAPPASCTSELSTKCTACATNFKPAGAYPNSCDFDTAAAGLVLSKSTTDFTLSSNPGKTCSAIPYNFGQYGNNTAVTISSISPISQSHYQFQLLVWIILFDNWSGGYVDFKLTSTGQNFSVSQTNQSASQQYCFGSNQDGYVRFDGTYTHSETSSNIQFLMSSVTTTPSALFGIRDILLIAKYCHSFCKTCTGPASTVCSACNTGYFLSSTQCATDCLTGYGKNLPSNVCIVCNAYCLTCETSATNCLTCRNIVSTVQIYKVQDQNSCVSTCSAGYFSHLATKKCLLCSLHCVNMTINGQLAADSMSLQFLYTFTEAMDLSATFNYATFLTFSSDNASINANTDFNRLYTVVDSTHFKLKLTPKANKYLVNTNICTNILPQASNPYQYSLALNKLSPSVYTTTKCVLWSTPQAGMTVNGYVDSSQTFGEFIFEFTDTMNFGGFVHTNFVFFNGSDASLNMVNDFTVTYSMINATSFKLKLAPKPLVYFTDTTFCAITFAQGSTSLQFTANNLKLNPSVYNAYDCITFSTPKVKLAINSQLDSSLKFLDFTYTFTEPMDFTGFVYGDFVLLNQSDALISLATNFSVLYTAVDDTRFTLRLTPNIGTYFALTTFCTTTKAQTATTLQFSKDLFKLDPSVYGQQNCIIWTIPSVNMTISSQVINLGKYVQFNFTFDAPMNFNSFSYSDFLNFALSDTSLNLASDFTVNYTQIDGNSFQLIITPLQQVQFKNLEFCTSSKSRTSTSLQSSQDNTVLNPTVYNQLNCLIWSTPLPSIFTSDQQKYYKNLEIFNNHIEQFTTQKGTQQIIKSGVFAFLMPGAQLSTTVLLHQPRIAQNLYEGSRFWGSFIFFDVPPYQKNSNKTKFTFSQADKQIILKSKTRRLQETDPGTFIKEWKFQRTGHTGFFIFDTYIQMLMIGLSWLLCLVVLVYKIKCKPKASTLWKFKARVMAFFHKVHEVSFFYLVLSGLIEYRNLDTSNYLHTLSMVFASFFLFYYLVYELKVFYDLINYPNAKIGTREYQKFVQNYGIYLAYYRFQEYNDRRQWNWRHFFRPYNYHTLTFIKKTLMLTAVPLFYDHDLWPVIILSVIQALDLVRFLLTLPYQSSIRNFFYFFLQSLLFIFFLCSLINQLLSQSIYDSNGSIINIENAETYKNSGWLGMIVLFLYNILYILSNLVEFGILLFTKSSIENLTWSNRNSYYQELYEHFEEYGSYYRLVKNYTDQLAYNTERRQVKSLKGWVNRFHGAEPLIDLSEDKLKVFKQIYERGDLFTTQFQQNMFKDYVEVKIQTFKIKDFQRIIRVSNFHKGQFAPKHEDEFIKHQTRSSSPYKKPQKDKIQTKSMRNLLEYKKDDPILNFDIEYQIVPQVYIADPLVHKQTTNNIYVPKKIKNTICTLDLNPHFQKNLVMTLISYQMPGTDELKLSTILRVDLKNYEEGQQVIYRREDMRQQISIKRGRKIHKILLKQMIQGFPADWASLQKNKQKDKQTVIEKQENQTNRKLLRIQV